MKIGVFGTGEVGRTIAGKFADLGHSVHIGTRDLGIESRMVSTPGIDSKRA